MKNNNKIKMSLADVKEYFESIVYWKNCKIFETKETYGIIDRGKYNSGLTFIIPKSFNETKEGEAANPLRWFQNRYVTDNMNIDFDASEIYFMLGDYWVSKKDTNCFRPKSPKYAKHMLIKASWGGPFDHTRGYRGYRKQNYFRRALSNNGGMGNDFYVVPVGYAEKIYDPELDGPIPFNGEELNNTCPYEEEVRKICQKMWEEYNGFR